MIRQSGRRMLLLIPVTPNEFIDAQPTRQFVQDRNERQEQEDQEE
jgi:hypothetical protein